MLFLFVFMLFSTVQLLVIYMTSNLIWKKWKRKRKQKMFFFLVALNSCFLSSFSFNHLQPEPRKLKLIFTSYSYYCCCVPYLSIVTSEESFFVMSKKYEKNEVFIQEKWFWAYNSMSGISFSFVNSTWNWLWEWKEWSVNASANLLENLSFTFWNIRLKVNLLKNQNLLRDL